MKKQNRIKNLSSKRGHKPCTNSWRNIISRELVTMILQQIGREAKPMAQKVIEMGLTPVSEYLWFSEVMLHYPGLYAGSTDLGLYAQ